MYHPRTVHSCNVNEVSTSKSMILKLLIYLFYIFVIWFITFGKEESEPKENPPFIERLFATV